MKHIDLINIGERGYSVNEAFKALRANLLFCCEQRQSIVITSCLPNDGKSTITVELAKSLAADGKKILIIDTDLRKSSLRKRLLEQPNIAGFSEYLSRQAEMSDVLYETQIQNLYIIFAGAVPPNPAELLGSERFGVIEELKKSFDFILCDTPPLGSVIDSAIVANRCDGAIMVFSENRVSRRLAKSILYQLEKSECDIIGAIMNREKPIKKKYYSKYYYKYSKYYTYGRYYDEYGDYEDVVASSRSRAVKRFSDYDFEALKRAREDREPRSAKASGEANSDK